MNSDLCDYGIGFIQRLLSLSPDKNKMDLVLENFTVLYVSNTIYFQKNLFFLKIFVLKMLFFLENNGSENKRNVIGVSVSV